jgi:hypothetical protein
VRAELFHVGRRTDEESWRRTSHTKQSAAAKWQSSQNTGENVSILFNIVCWVYLGTNSHYFFSQHELTGFCNRDGKCLPRATSWMFKYITHYSQASNLPALNKIVVWPENDFFSTFCTFSCTCTMTSRFELWASSSVVFIQTLANMLRGTSVYQQVVPQSTWSLSKIQVHWVSLSHH